MQYKGGESADGRGTPREGTMEDGLLRFCFAMNFLETDALATQHQGGEMPLKALLTTRTLMEGDWALLAQDRNSWHELEGKSVHHCLSRSG